MCHGLSAAKKSLGHRGKMPADSARDIGLPEVGWMNLASVGRALRKTVRREATWQPARSDRT
jgi:hypothetical protein